MAQQSAGLGGLEIAGYYHVCTGGEAELAVVQQCAVFINVHRRGRYHAAGAAVYEVARDPYQRAHACLEAAEVFKSC